MQLYDPSKWRALTAALLLALGAPSHAETLTNSQGMEFIKVPAGSFTMGCNAGETCKDDEKPGYTKTIRSSFWLAKTEVTQAQYKAVMGSNPSSHKGDDKLPVERVDVAGAEAFADALSQDEGCNRCYRLPTEEEWEYAARLDGATLRNAVYGGRGNGIEGPEPVCSRKPGKWGFCDLLGNVWEWTSSRYTKDYYNNTPTQEFRVTRGGSYLDHAGDVRPGSRSYDMPVSSRGILGFRLLRTNP